MLCNALMKVQDCFTLTQVPADRQRLIANVLAILLACSFSARKVALDGVLYICDCTLALALSLVPGSQKGKSLRYKALAPSRMFVWKYIELCITVL